MGELRGSWCQEGCDGQDCGPYCEIKVIRSSDSCDVCRWFDREGSYGNGLCRVNPPVRVPGEEFGEWPRVDEADWCGSFVLSRLPDPTTQVEDDF